MTRRTYIPDWSNTGATRAPVSSNATPVSAVTFKRALAVGEQAAFLWDSRRAVVRSSAVTLDVLARMDERLSRLVYKLSERPVLAEGLLRHDHSAFKSGLTFVTAIVALRGGVVEVFDRLLARLETDAEFLSPLASALSWLEYGEVRACVNRLLTAQSPALLQLGVLAAVSHRVDPGAAMNRALDAEAPALRGSALEAIGRLALRNLAPRLEAALDDQDATCRFWAAWSAVRLGDHSGIRILGRFAAESSAFAGPACDMALRALDPDQALRAHTRLLSMPGNHRLAVVAAGMIGDPTLVGWLLDVMQSSPLARCAGAAFCLMTGCDLRRDDLDAAAPPGSSRPDAAAEGESDEDSTADKPGSDTGGGFPVGEIDDDLVWPDTTRLRRWWGERRSAFVPGARYLAGLPVRHEEMMQVLRTGNQQVRAAAALELGILHPDAPLLDVTAPAHRQVGTVS